MAPFDLVLLFLFGGIAITAVVGEDHSMTGATTALATIGLMNVGVSWLKERSRTLGRLIDGTPVVIFEKGEWHRGRMHALRVMEADVMAAMRQRGLMRVDQVRYAVVERDGKVSIIPES